MTIWFVMKWRNPHFIIYSTNQKNKNGTIAWLLLDLTKITIADQCLNSKANHSIWYKITVCVQIFLCSHWFTMLFIFIRVFQSGWYSALPFIANWINMNVSALIADQLITSKKLTIAQTRKLFSSIGNKQWLITPMIVYDYDEW